MLENTLINATKAQRGNATILALVAVLVVALGAGAYYSGVFTKSNAAENTPVGTQAAAEPASGTPAAQTADAKPADAAPAKEGEPTIIKPGNPVVAKLNGKDITRVDVFNFMQTLSPQVRQMPIDQLFPLALEQVVNGELINEKMKAVNLSSDPLVKQEMEVAKKQIERSVFMQKEADKAMTDDLINAAYNDYKKNFPKMDEIKAQHILVKDEQLAKDLIKKIKDGADFATLAKENSLDATKENGGELGYFVKEDVVPEFADAVFALSKDEVTSKPVKTEFGYHVIKMLDKRERQPATLEQAKPFLVAQLRGQVLNTVVQKWREDAKLEVYNINGEAIEPSAGGDSKPSARAEKKPQ